jgi:hypothetical protein
MKLSAVMASHGWTPFEATETSKYKQLKVYQKDSLLMGVQKIGNVFRVDIQECLEMAGQLMPIQKVLDGQIVEKDQLETALKDLLPQLSPQF